MRRLPLWIKCFILCLFGVVFSIFILSIVTFFRIYEDKEYIIRTNAKNISTYVDMNVVEKLSMIEERFCGVSVAENLRRTLTSDDIDLQLSQMLADTSDVLGIYYIDNYGTNYAIGDVSGDLISREELIREAKTTEAYKSRGRTWFYLKTYRGYNACVLFADVVYIEADYSKSTVGQMLLYVDADKINKPYLNNISEEEEGIIITDPDGNIVFSTKNDWRGKNFNESFSEQESRFTDYNGEKYVFSSYESEIQGWRNIVYFNTNIIRKQTVSLFALILVVALFCLALVLGLSYYIAARIGKPIDDLFRYIKVSNTGNVVLPDNISGIEAEEIKAIFDSVTEKLKQQMDSIYLAEIEVKNLKIKAYESQINPHFIFNTLQIVQMLSVLGETDKVNEIITCLGEMMRFNLDNAATVKLIDEISIVENYFKILKYRYRDNFNYKIIIEDEMYDCEVLKFTIQPFVENAIKHGFRDKKGLWEIMVMGKRVNDEIVLVIRDNGQGIPKEKLDDLKMQLSGEVKLHDGNGIGICNVNNRIKLVYGPEYGVDIYCDRNTHAVVHMPFSKKNNEEGESDV